ncbi:MAG TPA: hypothetical protein VHV82_00535 [Sporichthyaceae bacterium]|nr:hypothetical protein [Sporichthyaceae bacterium]
MIVKPSRRLGALLAASALTGLVLPATAGADTAPQYNAIEGEGNVSIADISFHAANRGPTGTAATGYFKGDNPVTHFHGPIICLQVDGKRAGFIYPVDKTSTPEAARGQNILITVEDIGAGATGKFGFKPLAPDADVTKCDPGDTPITAGSGHFTVNRTTTGAASTSTTRKELRK